MITRNPTIAELWQKWRPQGSALKLIALCLLGWLLVNSSAICFALGMPVFGRHISFQEHVAVFFLILSGIPLLKNWLFYWPCLPLLVPLFIGSALYWLKKPSIFRGALLAVSGMTTGPANHILFDDFFMLLSVPFAAFFLAFAWIMQKIWDNWDAPAPEEKEDGREKSGC